MTVLQSGAKLERVQMLLKQHAWQITYHHHPLDAPGTGMTPHNATCLYHVVNVDITLIHM